jgi:hypothetical protein
MGTAAAFMLAAFSSHPSGNGCHNSFDDSVRRWKWSSCTAVPNGASVGCQMVIVAPVLQSHGRTVIAQQLGIECFEQCERLDTSNKIRGPIPRWRRRRVIRTSNRRRHEQDSARK